MGMGDEARAEAKRVRDQRAADVEDRRRRDAEVEAAKQRWIDEVEECAREFAQAVHAEKGRPVGAPWDIRICTGYFRSEDDGGGVPQIWVQVQADGSVGTEGRERLRTSDLDRNTWGGDERNEVRSTFTKRLSELLYPAP